MKTENSKDNQSVPNVQKKRGYNGAKDHWNMLKENQNNAALKENDKIKKSKSAIDKYN